MLAFLQVVCRYLTALAYRLSLIEIVSRESSGSGDGVAVVGMGRDDGITVNRRDGNSRFSRRPCL